MQNWMKAALGSVVGAAAVCTPAVGAVVYSTVGSTYSETFTGAAFATVNGNSGFPTTDDAGGSFSASAGATVAGEGYANGWADDSVTNTDQISVTGWHLFHNTNLGTPNSTAEGGTNGNQRLRYSTGGQTAGSFYAFAPSSGGDPDKALGVLTSSAITPGGDRTYIGLQLINNTGQPLTSVTVTYDGEQWRDGGVQGSRDAFDLQYSTTATDDTWMLGSGFVGFANSFVSPVDGAATATGIGNTTGKIADITHTFPVTWAPGGELWIRWRDTELSGVADDGIAIDNVRVSATPEPGGLALLGLAAAGMLRRRK
jgi:MYXO-CTERM domain-containing protein